MPEVKFKDVYDANYGQSLLDSGNKSEYIKYINTLKDQVTDVSDRNTLSVLSGKLSTELSRQNYNIQRVRDAHGEDGVDRYNFVNAVNQGTSLSGNTYWDKYKTESDRLGSEIDEEGNIVRRAEHLSFAFDDEYDFNNFMSAAGFNMTTLQDSGIEYGKKNGKPYISVSKGNKNFINVIKGVNAIDDYSESGDFWEGMVKTLTRPLVRANRELDIHSGNGILDKLHGIYNAGTHLVGAGVSLYTQMPHVLMTSFDAEGRQISQATNDDYAWYQRYKAIGDRMLSDYKESNSILEDMNEDKKVPQQVQRLGYLTVNEAKARDYLKKTNNYTKYNAFLKEEYRRADIEIMNDHLGKYQVYSTLEGDYMEEVPYEDIPYIEDLIHNAISEGGDTNEGRRVHYETGMMGTDPGLYITIAPKSNDNKLSDAKDEYSNILPGRTFFVKGMLDDVTQAAINQDSKWRAYKEVQQLTNWNYDFYFKDGSMLTKCSNFGAVYIDTYGKEQPVDKAFMQAAINKEFATQDAESALNAMYKDSMTDLEDVNIGSEIEAYAYGIAANIINESYPNALPNEYQRMVSELYVKMLKDIGYNFNTYKPGNNVISPIKTSK